MADMGYVRTVCAGLDTAIKKVLINLLEYILGNLKFGRADDAAKSTNFGGKFFQGVTPAVANTEFSIEHALGVKPSLIVPVLPTDIVGAKLIRLETTRAADTNRVYLRSPDTSSVFYVYVEGG